LNNLDSRHKSVNNMRRCGELNYTYTSRNLEPADDRISLLSRLYSESLSHDTFLVFPRLLTQLSAVALITVKSCDLCVIKRAPLPSFIANLNDTSKCTPPSTSVL
jgi:hypothetical protein